MMLTDVLNLFTSNIIETPVNRFVIPIVSRSVTVKHAAATKAARAWRSARRQDTYGLQLDHSDSQRPKL